MVLEAGRNNRVEITMLTVMTYRVNEIFAQIQQDSSRTSKAQPEIHEGAQKATNSQNKFGLQSTMLEA